MKQDVVTVVYHNLIDKNGISVNKLGETPKSGYMVSLQGFEERYHKEDFGYLQILEYFTKHSATLDSMANIFFGGWVNEDIVYLDLSLNILDKESALRMGIRANQKAIWDVEKNEEIFLPTPQTSGTMTQQATYINMKVRELL